MSVVPWWALSPSPMTLTFFGILSFYGAYKLKSATVRGWIGNFAESAFVLGLVIMPFDSSWQIFQWLKWGFLYPRESQMVINVLIRNTAIFSLCLLSSWKLSEKTNRVILKNTVFVLIPILILILKFAVALDPGWTDWTYPMRFESSSPWQLSYLIGLIDKVCLAGVYVNLWKK